MKNSRQDVARCLDGMARYTCVPSHQQHMADTLLSDDIWLDTIFFPRNSEMLNDAYQKVVDSMSQIGVTAYKSEVQLLHMNS